MPISTSLQVLFFFCQIGLVDTYSFLTFPVNSGSQYLAIVVGAAAANSSSLSPRILLEPILRLGVSYQYVNAAKTVLERRARIATLAALMSTSGSFVGTGNFATNAAIGGTISTKI